MLPPGAAYILLGSAQGHTRACKEGCVAHQVCVLPSAGNTMWAARDRSESKVWLTAARFVASQVCSCCWTHGIWNDSKSTAVRQSVTLRVYNSSFGRDH